MRVFKEKNPSKDFLYTFTFFNLTPVEESDLGHLSNLFYILCGHFDEKKFGVPPTTLPGGSLSCQSQRVKGGGGEARQYYK